MSSEEEDGRLHRENMAEEIARAFHFAAADQGVKRGMLPLAAWDNLDTNIQESIKGAVLTLVDHGVIAPFSVVRNLQIELTEIKQTWGKLNDMMGGS